MQYHEWNRELTKYFFNEENAGREVVLFVDRKLIETVGAPFGAGVDDFVDAIVKGPTLLGPKKNNTIVKNAVTTYEISYGSSKPNPYKRDVIYFFAYLAFFVYITTLEAEGDYSDTAYYPKAEELLDGKAKFGKFPSDGEGNISVRDLWEALEYWSKEQKKGKLGLFTVRVRGKKHVGIPQSQTLITDEERGRLPKFFDEYGYSPTDPRAEKILHRELERDLKKSGILSGKTKKLLEQVDSAELRNALRQALLEIVTADLRNWDWEVPVEAENGALGRGTVRPRLRICMELDGFTRKVTTTVRFKVGEKQELSDEALFFTREKDGSRWCCYDQDGVWSSELLAAESEDALDASLLDWEVGELFKDEQAVWFPKLKASKAMVFATGESEGLSGTGWVQVESIERCRAFRLAVAPELIGILNEWGNDRNNCDEFKRIDVSQGLREGWSLYQLRGVKREHPTIECLRFDSLFQVKIEGISVGRNKYLYHLMPKVSITGLSEEKLDSVRVSVDGKELSREGDRWVLHSGTARNRTLTLTASLEENSAKPVKFTIVDEGSKDETGAVSRDRFGKMMKHEASGTSLAGTLVIGEVADDGFISDKALRRANLSGRVTLLGCEPGQLIELSPFTRPDIGWEPVWAVVKTGKDRYQAYYVADDLEKKPRKNSKLPPHEKNEWKKMFKKEITPPPFRRIENLWKAYKIEAKRI